MYGRTIIVFTSAVPGKVIDTQHFSSGDIVSISENGLPPSQLNTDKTTLSGTVTKSSGQSVSVAIDIAIENVFDELRESETYKLIKLCNYVTHKRIKGALLSLKEARLSSRGAHLADVLFQRTEPQQTPSNNLIEELKFFNTNLDKSQQEAVKFSFQQKDLAIIHG